MERRVYLLQRQLTWIDESQMTTAKLFCFVFFLPSGQTFVIYFREKKKKWIKRWELKRNYSTRCLQKLVHVLNMNNLCTQWFCNDKKKLCQQWITKKMLVYNDDKLWIFQLDVDRTDVTSHSRTTHDSSLSVSQSVGSVEHITLIFHCKTLFDLLVKKNEDMDVDVLWKKRKIMSETKRPKSDFCLAASLLCVAAC